MTMSYDFGEWDSPIVGSTICRYEFGNVFAPVPYGQGLEGRKGTIRSGTQRGNVIVLSRVWLTDNSRVHSPYHSNRWHVNHVGIPILPCKLTENIPLSQRDRCREVGFSHSLSANECLLHARINPDGQDRKEGTHTTKSPSHVSQHSGKIPDNDVLLTVP
jgi:hypothetical protein